MALMGIDQFGNYYHGIDEKAPKRSLLAMMSARSAKPQYQEFHRESDRDSVQTGYVVPIDGSEYWVTLFKVTPWEKSA